MKTKHLLLMLVLSFIVGLMSNIYTFSPCVCETYYADSYMKKERIAILYGGDTCAYQLYMDSVRCNKRIPRSNSFVYSLRMAICNNYAPAHYDAYETIMKVYPDVGSMDAETKKLCVFLLKRGADRDELHCLDELKRWNVKYRKKSYLATDEERNVWERMFSATTDFVQRQAFLFSYFDWL